MLKYLSNISRNQIQEKEVMKMADRNKGCGCGCIPLKQNTKKATKDEKKPKKTVKSK
jgi:hypothetical protein